MLLTNHTLTGIALGLTIDDPFVLAPLAVTSHFALDSVPHFGDKRLALTGPAGRKLAAVDCSIALILALVATAIWPHRIVQLFIGVVGASAPDLLYIPRYIFKKQFWEPLFSFHHLIQTERLWLFPVELIWATTMLMTIKAFS